MATTILTVVGNRATSGSYLVGNSAAVPVDAAVLELFVLPATFGQLLIESMKVIIFSLSGAYVAPAPPFDGIGANVLSPDATTGQDILFAKRFVNTSTASARPQLEAYSEFFRRVLMRQAERVSIQAPILAGAGVTATVQLQLRGLRIETA